MKAICETERLVIRQFSLRDTEFILRLLNDESFIRHIADKNVRSQEDAVNYLANGPISSYETYGFGFYLVLLKGKNVPIGMCGLIKRGELDLPDLGYAFLPQFCGQGYAREAAEVVLQKEMSSHALDTVLAITFPGNQRSISLLEKIGFRFKGTMALYGLHNNLYEYQG